MQQAGLSDTERLADYKLEATMLAEAAKKLERYAILIESAAHTSDSKARLRSLCNDHIVKTFEDQICSSETDREFLQKLFIALNV